MSSSDATASDAMRPTSRRRSRGGRNARRRARADAGERGDGTAHQIHRGVRSSGGTSNTGASDRARPRLRDETRAARAALERAAGSPIERIGGVDEHGEPCRSARPAPLRRPGVVRERFVDPDQGRPSTPSDHASRRSSALRPEPGGPSMESASPVANDSTASRSGSSRPRCRRRAIARRLRRSWLAVDARGAAQCDGKLVGGRKTLRRVFRGRRPATAPSRRALRASPLALRPRRGPTARRRARTPPRAP